MAKNLVIVESPAKAKTIEKFLGKDYKVASSFGHIADLPSKELGVNVEGDFLPKYIISSDKKKLVTELKSMVKKAETVWLASDEDREGEAIAWHLAQTLKLKEENTKRIVFHEITKNAILKAIENPRQIDYNLVNAQQARRVLDRLVGYELSPVLWKKVKGGLSAGRVQSVSVRLIVEREREIKAFLPKASFKTQADFLTGGNKIIKGQLNINFDQEEAVGQFLEKNKTSVYTVASKETKPAKKSPTAPFTTSTLQQEAARKLYFSVSKTMTVAQRLYESGERVLGEHPDSGRVVKVRLGKFGPIAQIGNAEDDEKPVFASLAPEQQLDTITFEEALELFKLPKDLGEYEGEIITVNNGRYGPYVKFRSSFVSLPKGASPMDLDREEAIALIEAKKKADAPIYTYNQLPVTKGTGRFGPFIKWSGMFINVNKKYDFDNLSEQDIVTLIEEKIQKEKDKLVQHWEEEGIRIEKARWGRSNIIQGKIKVELSKDIDPTKITLAEAQKRLAAKKPAKKKATKRKAKK